MPVFDSVPTVPLDAIFLVKKNYEADPSTEKIDVGIGAYRDDNGKPYVLNVVKEAEKALLEDPAQNKEYLGIAGNALFITETRKFAFGATSKRVLDKSIATVQSLSGTGALRLGLEFLAQTLGKVNVFIPNPTWGNHRDLCTRSHLEHASYRYWDPSTKALNFEGMMEDLQQAPQGSVVILHSCSHNPTGVDPSKSQWREILQLVQQNKLIPFFDSAYQGFASGDVVEDAYALRLFAEAGVELLVAQSYSKNLGLYGERVGALSIACTSASVAVAVESQLKKIIRAMYSNPPRHGAAIVAMILSKPDMYDKWMVELKGMTDRIKAMREGLRTHLEVDGDDKEKWAFITEQIGMFTYTGLDANQVAKLQKEFHIYMPNNGRISIAGLTENKLGYFADAIKSVL